MKLFFVVVVVVVVASDQPAAKGDKPKVVHVGGHRAADVKRVAVGPGAPVLNPANTQSASPRFDTGALDRRVRIAVVNCHAQAVRVEHLLIPSL